MTTLELGLDGRAPAGWSVSHGEGPRIDTYLGFTRDIDAGQAIMSRIEVSVLKVSDATTSLEMLAYERRATQHAHHDVRLRRAEFISEIDPEIYGHEIRFETELSPHDRIAVVQSEILFTFSGFKTRVLSFLLTAPEYAFDECLPDFKALFDSINVQESE
ncbi:hypothetical protein [Mycobacteroides abscessus]|uniref:hypothetical protein n=1 Tax=Mycobacteroides abscessus TaxID=36809 RepID=UPI00094115E1|nr:hypothetical protein [Mycobacteroides abscessus]